MPDKLMSIKTDTVLKTTIETIAMQTNKKGSINARNLLDMAFHKKVKETYHFPQNNGNNARLINQNNDELTKEIDNKLNVSENQEKYNLYPNPNQGNFTLAYQNQEKELSYFTIIDFTGKIVFQRTLTGKQGKENITTANLQSGIYFIRINNTDGKLLHSNKLSVIR